MTSKEGDKNMGLTLEGFIRFIKDFAKQDVRSVFIGLRSCGFDMFMERVFPAEFNSLEDMSWTKIQDEALVKHGNMLAQKFNCSPLKISSNEIYLTEIDLVSEGFKSLQSLSLEDVRTHYSIIVAFNQAIEKYLLPLVDFRCAGTYVHSIAEYVQKGRNLIFYEVKSNLLRKFLNASNQRNPDHAPPEINLDPVEEIGNTHHDVCSTLFSQALNQLSEIQSAQMNVPVAFGGDPQYPFNIKMQGEEVMGNSGSFRHFMTAMVEQLQSPILNLLVPYKGTGSFAGRYFLKPGPMNFGEEKMLQFFGQLLGISLRSGIPLALNMMPTFWKTFVNTPYTQWRDCRDLDPVTYLYLEDTESQLEDNFSQFLEENDFPKFTYHSLTGDIVEICSDGMNIDLEWDNKHEYVNSIKTLKLKEWQSQERMNHILAGLATMAPLAFIQNTFSADDAELQFCGQSFVDLKFLRQHTIYQVGILEDDPHVVHFWSALESFSQAELGKFIKFACNQDRIPMTGPRESSQMPPYPMKLAPPDKREGDMDQQFIRVETCMFMIKLPRYTTLQVMREKLLYAISCALDPLSG